MKQIQEFDALFRIQLHSTKLLTHPNFCDTCVIGSVFKISIDTWRPHRYITLFHCSRSGLCIPEKQTYIPFPRNRFPFNSLNPFEKVKHNFRKIYSLENLYVYITVFFPFRHAIFSLSSFRVVCILWIFCFVQVRHFIPDSCVPMFFANCMNICCYITDTELNISRWQFSPPRSLGSWPQIVFSLYYNGFGARTPNCFGEKIAFSN